MVRLDVCVVTEFGDVCFQAGASTLLPHVHQPVLPAGGGRVSVQQRRYFPAAASLPGLRAGGRVCVLLHHT